MGGHGIDGHQQVQRRQHAGICRYPELAGVLAGASVPAGLVRLRLDDQRPHARQPGQRGDLPECHRPLRVPVSATPHQSDARPGVRAGQPVWVGTQVGHLPGQVIGRTAEHVGQLHQLHVDVIVHLRGAVVQRQQPVDPGNLRKQRQQARLRPHGHLGRKLPEQRDIADELQGVAQAVIAAHQHPPAFQRGPGPHVLLVPRQVVAGTCGPRRQPGIAHLPGPPPLSAPHVPRPRVVHSLPPQA